MAVVDIATARVTAIKPLGTKDHSLRRHGPGRQRRGRRQQHQQRHAGASRSRPQPVKGLYLPDAIARYTVGGQSYLITANEGDARADWPGFNEETRVRAHCSAGPGPDGVRRRGQPDPGFQPRPPAHHQHAQRRQRRQERRRPVQRALQLRRALVLDLGHDLDRVFDSGDELRAPHQCAAQRRLQRQPRQQHARWPQRVQGPRARRRGGGAASATSTSPSSAWSVWAA